MEFSYKVILYDIFYYIVFLIIISLIFTFKVNSPSFDTETVIDALPKQC